MSITEAALRDLGETTTREISAQLQVQIRELELIEAF